MKKTITIDFHDDFTPPEKYNREVCCSCPFVYESDYGSGCGIQDYYNYKTAPYCPIKKYFD